MKIPLEHFILCQIILLVVLCECSDQEADSQQDTWDSLEETRDQDNDNYITEKEDLTELEPNEIEENVQEEKQESTNVDGEVEKDYVMIKRDVQRHINGKKKPMLKHVHKRKEGEKRLADKVSASESGVSYEKPKRLGGSSKYAENKRYTMKDGKSHFYHSASVNFGNSVISKPKLSEQVRYTTTLPNYDSNQNIDFPVKELNTNVLNSTKNAPKLNFDMDRTIEEDSMTVNAEGLLNNTNEKHKHFRNKKPKSSSLSKLEKEEFVSPDKESKRIKLFNENPSHTRENKIKHEDKLEEGNNEQLRHSNFNKLFSTNVEKDQNNQDAVYSEIYKNMSLINQSFLNAFQNRYLKNYLKHEKKSKHNPKPGLVNSQSITESITNNRNDHTDMTFTEEEANINKNNESNFDYSFNNGANHSLNRQKYESSPNDIKHNSFNISDIETDLKLEDKLSGPRKRKVYNPKMSLKTHKHKQVNTLSTVSDSESKVIGRDKHKNKISKKLHGKDPYTKETDVENSLMDRNKESLYLDNPVEKDMSESVLTETEQNKRNERDTQRSNHKLNKNDHNANHGSNVFGLMPDGEIEDETYDNKVQEGDEGTGLENEEEEQKQPSIYKPNEDGRYLPNNGNSQKSKYDASREGYDLGTRLKRLHAKRAHMTQSSEDESSNTDSCVEYKADKALSTTECITTSTEQTRSSLTTRSNNNIKIKTTPKTNNKTQSTKKPNIPNGLNVSYPGEIGEYEQFLCGQLADSFVEAVLTKVHRSRKLSKELGFNNDTDESCDRCIETRASKIPDIETMRSSLGKCERFNSSTKYCVKCCNIPEPIEQFINTLLKFEKENENSVYTKIRDDSSFIFTGDYPDSLSQKDNTMALNGEKDSFSKDSFEKQHLREGGHEETSGDQIPNKNSMGNLKHSSSPEDNDQEDDTVNAQEDTEDEDNEAKGDLKLKPSKHAKVKDMKYEAGEQHPLQSDENLKGNDIIDIFDTQDSISSDKQRHSGLKDFNSGGSSDLDAFKRSHKVFNNKVINPQSTDRNEPGVNGGRNFVDQQYKKRNFNYFGYPAKSELTPKQQYRDAGGFHVASGYKEPYVDFRERHQNSFQLNSGRPHKENNLDYRPQTVLSNSANSKYNPKNNIFGYAPQTYSKSEQLSQSVNRKPAHYMSGSFMNPEFDRGEYPLYPNREGETRKNMMSLSGNYKNYYSDGLRMDKREAEPYEDEVIFFEIPDIEYDLY